MQTCQAYKDARQRWLAKYRELEKRYAKAEQHEDWQRVEIIGEALVKMEADSGFKKCFSCGKKGCPARFDGWCSWDPMNEKCQMIDLRGY